MENTYKIPVQFLDLMNGKLEKLNKKAVKLGLKPIEIEILDTEMYEREEGLEIPCYTVRLTQIDQIKINGYEFVGKLEKNVGETYIYKGSEGVPKEQKDIRICQHCNTKRNRKTYYILKHENGEYITVGKSCLIDFIGHVDAEKIANFYQNLKNLIEEEFESWGGDWDFEPTAYSIDQVLKATVVSIKARGYHKSDSETMPTKEHVFLILDNKERNNGYGDLFEEAMKIPKENIDEMKNIINDLEPNSDYIENLQLLIKDGFVKSNMMGYVVSIPCAVDREKEKRLKESIQKDINSKSDYVGEVGEKIEKEVSYLKYTSFESFYGTSCKVTYLYMFLDNEGNCIVWRTGKAEDFEVGDKIKISGRIKEHKEYRGLKQTILTRAKYTVLDK